MRMLAEGGSVTLSAVRGPEGWTSFTLVTDESTLFDLLGDDDGAGPRTTGPADTWEGAMGLLDCYAWPMLYPDFVHQDFRVAVIAAVRERAASDSPGPADFVLDRLPDWEHRCSLSDEP